MLVYLLDKNVARKTILGIGRVERGMVPRPEEVFFGLSVHQQLRTTLAISGSKTVGDDTAVDPTLSRRRFARVADASQGVGNAQGCRVIVPALRS
jgi:hypothetical protein